MAKNLDSSGEQSADKATADSRDASINKLTATALSAFNWLKNFIVYNKNISIYCFAAFSGVLAIIITLLVTNTHYSPSHIIDIPTSTAQDEHDNSGKHCLDNSVVINFGSIECSQIVKIMANMHPADISAPNRDSGFSCSSAPSHNPEYYFYDFWCSNSRNSFFGSFQKNYYAHFPSGFSHWIKDPSIFLRQQKPGVDFRTKNNTVQCIIVQRMTALLQCAGDFPIKPGQTIPNNLVNLPPNAPATIGFGQTIEFSYGKRMVLEPGDSLYYLHYACQSTDTDMTCRSLLGSGLGFLVSHDYWTPLNN